MTEVAPEDQGQHKEIEPEAQQGHRRQMSEEAEKRELGRNADQRVLGIVALVTVLLIENRRRRLRRKLIAGIHIGELLR